MFSRLNYRGPRRSSQEAASQYPVDEGASFDRRIPVVKKAECSKSRDRAPF